MTVDCCGFFLFSLLWTEMRFQSETSVFKFLRCSVDYDSFRSVFSPNTTMNSNILPVLQA